MNAAENSIKEFNRNNNKIPKEKLVDLHFTVLTVPFNLCMLTMQI